MVKSITPSYIAAGKQASVARYVIPGRPIPLQRARMGGRGMRPWDPQKSEKNIWMQCLEEQQDNRSLFIGPIKVEIQFFFAVPLAHMKRAAYLINTPHFYTPDVDNLEKFVLDCARGIVYKDDCQVAQLSSWKSYAIEACTIFMVSPISYTHKFQFEEMEHHVE